MKQLRFAILQGLAQHRKDIFQIINEAGIEPTHRQLSAAIRHLETLGLIRTAGRQVTDLTAEVTPFGKEVLHLVH